MANSAGFYCLSDAPARINIECGNCDRKGSYSRDRAIAQHGDVTLPTFLTIVSADCPRRGAINGYQCAAHYAKDSQIEQ